MDILKEISQKLSLLDEPQVPQGIRAVLVHIEIAEQYYARATTEKNSYMFTDVIYRTNHAFEGILKEAFIILEDKSSSKKTPYDIEAYLTQNSVFKERVMELFTNYRANWRNPSTHDYQLFFTQQEAFLAIVTVSAFVNILVDRIVERISYQTEINKMERRAKEIKSNIKKYESFTLIEKITAILAAFSEEFKDDYENLVARPENQLMGMLAGFVASIEPDVKIDSSPVFNVEGQAFRPSLLIETGKEQVIVEVQHAVKYNENEHPDTEDIEILRMKRLLTISGINNGVVYYYPNSHDDVIITSLVTGKIMRDHINIREVSYLSAEYYKMIHDSAEFDTEEE